MIEQKKARFNGAFFLSNSLWYNVISCENSRYSAIIKSVAIFFYHENRQKMMTRKHFNFMIKKHNQLCGGEERWQLLQKKIFYVQLT